MNVIGLGIDLVEIEPFAEKLSRVSFREQVFTANEQLQADDRRKSAEAYAGKFAVKEAVMKSLGAGVRQGVWFTAIEVLSDEAGAPKLTLHRVAQSRAEALGITAWHISISHTGHTAVAVVLAIGDS